MYYLTPKDLKEEARVIHETIKDVAGDLGGDINYLNDRLNEFEERIAAMESQLAFVIKELQEWQKQEK
mgnify:FL=1|jgi:hypothetical protein|tara:strand:+ start:353 stop:556 length:204 start_codon:yes stop_codon:yes gene_type:complete